MIFTHNFYRVLKKSEFIQEDLPHYDLLRLSDLLEQCRIHGIMEWLPTVGVHCSTQNCNYVASVRLFWLFVHHRRFYYRCSPLLKMRNSVHTFRNQWKRDELKLVRKRICLFQQLSTLPMHFEHQLLSAVSLNRPLNINVLFSKNW